MTIYKNGHNLWVDEGTFPQNLRKELYMKNINVTIKDIAAEAGVSVSTVSRVITGTGRVSADTKKHVQEIMQKLNYRPNMSAQGLKTQRTRNIFLIVPDISNPFYADIAKTLQNAILEKGYILTLYNTNESPDEEIRAIEAAFKAYAGGIVFASISQHKSIVEKLLNSKIPSVLLNSYDRCEIDSVHGRREYGTYLSAKYLIDNGHERIAFAGGVTSTTIGNSRKGGYVKALREAGIEIDDRLIFEMGFSEDAGYKAGKYFLSLDNPPTAICCANDMIAMGVLFALREEKVRVPDDISLTGMDNISYSKISSPPLTSVTNSGCDFAKYSFKLLFERIEGKYKGEPREIILNRELVVRDSVKTIVK